MLQCLFDPGGIQFETQAELPDRLDRVSLECGSKISGEVITIDLPQAQLRVQQLETRLPGFARGEERGLCIGRGLLAFDAAAYLVTVHLLVVQENPAGMLLIE